MAVSHPRVRKHIHPDHYDEHGLLGFRTAAEYNDAERKYSTLLYRRIEQILKGERDLLLLLRKYTGDDTRLGTMPTPDDLDRTALRLDVVEHMTTDALVYLSDRSTGGPVAQECDAEGRRVEIRKFPTRYPHIIMERIDSYAPGSPSSEYVEWRARRVQNQRRQFEISRVLDVTNLSIDVMKLFI